MKLSSHHRTQINICNQFDRTSKRISYHFFIRSFFVTWRRESATEPMANDLARNRHISLPAYYKQTYHTTESCNYWSIKQNSNHHTKKNAVLRLTWLQGFALQYKNGVYLFPVSGGHPGSLLIFRAKSIISLWSINEKKNGKNKYKRTLIPFIY